MATLSHSVVHEDVLSSKLTTSNRVQSLDILRGLIIVLMAIDHVRVYSGLPPGGPDAGIFFTRWITHFCAPGFAFFAGTSAFLYGSKVNDKGKLARFLVTRGLLLVFLELTVIRFFWEFNLNYGDFILAGVIWMLGWSMVALAALIWLSPKAVGIIGLAIIFLQQIFSFIPKLFPSPVDVSFAKGWEFIYSSGYDTFEGIAILYVLIPWIGVMAAGYGFGTIVTLDEKARNKYCTRIGLTCVMVFVVVGSTFAISNPSEDMPFIQDLLNQRKYPASQLYLMMTLGPLILLIPFAERMKGWVADVLKIFGRVPFFYYLMHILVIHISALIFQQITLGAMHHDWFSRAPFSAVPEEFRWTLPQLYLVFAIDIVILFFVCRWYSNYKVKHSDQAWTKYL
jgi:uncharacterized membrane protein